MLYEQAKVIKRHDKDLIWVETQIKSSCNACSQNNKCGTGMIAKTLAPKTNQVLVACEHRVEAEQMVTIAVPEQSIVLGSLILYGLPLVSFMLGLVLSQLWFEHELLNLTFALVTGTSGFLVAKYLSRTLNQKHALPYVVEKISSIPFVCIEKPE